MTVATRVRGIASDFDKGSTRVRVPDGSWWAVDVGEVASEFSTDLRQGLSDSEVGARRSLYGSNALEVHSRVRPIAILIRQFRSVIVALLGAALFVALLFGETLEAIAIGAVIVINAAIGFFTELRAERSMEALLRLASHTARVVREGQIRIVSAEELVPGDLLILEAGDVVTADVRLAESSNLESDESILTGESLPATKETTPVAPHSPIHARSSMLFKGASVSRGSARGVVVATGQQTELGQIAELSRSSAPESTPLERRLDRLGRRLVGLTLVIGIVITVVGVLSDKDLYLMVQTAVALAVATIPEGLPIVATIALAAGVRRMARRNVLINRLSSVETLGSTHVICTDKTGTLTENRMTVAEVVTCAGRFGAEDLRPQTLDLDLLEVDSFVALSAIAGLCSDAVSGDESGGGEPMERALYRWLDRTGMAPHAVRERYPRVRTEAFDPNIKMMATIHEARDGFLVAVKGAPENVLDVSTRVMGEAGSEDITDQQRLDWLRQADRMGLAGQRVLGLAFKRMHRVEGERAYIGLEFVGLVGMFDPPRQEVSAAVRACRAAGIEVIMVTGDQPGTAASVAQSVGLDLKGGDVRLGRDLDRAGEAGQGGRGGAAPDLLNTTIFARVSPRQKLNLIALHQAAGRVVAMTGDGVNDAPALNKADIGVAMGVRGTEVAKEAADVVLLDDAFSSIVAAVREGRIIFDNIRTFVVYLMSCNLSEVLVVGLSTVVGGPLPILPLQILFLNLVTDVFPALALGVGRGRTDILEEEPRSRSTPVLRRSEWLLIAGLGAIMTAAVLGSLYVALRILHLTPSTAVTISFMTLVFSQLANVFNMRGARSSLFRNEVTSNRFVWMALALCTMITMVALMVPTIARTMSLENPGFQGALIVAAGSALTLILGQALVTALPLLAKQSNEAADA